VDYKRASMPLPLDPRLLISGMTTEVDSDKACREPGRTGRDGNEGVMDEGYD
jgi:hypothetical protein